MSSTGIRVQLQFFVLWMFFGAPVGNVDMANIRRIKYIHFGFDFRDGLLVLDWSFGNDMMIAKHS